MSTCYYPNGTAAPSAYGPCNGPTVTGMCCASWDTCREDGLCLDNADKVIWRESCTDQTWASPKCLKLCVTGQSYDGTNDGAAENHDALITICDNNSLCCGLSNTSCCAANEGVWIVNGEITDTNPLGVTSGSNTATYVSTIASTTTLAHSSSTTNPTITPISGGLGKSGIIGVGVGVPIGVAIIVLLSWLYIRERRLRQNLERNQFALSDPKSTSESKNENLTDTLQTTILELPTSTM